jgi:hypothetical protein
MKRQHPDPRMSMPISHEIYQKLCSASVLSGFAQEDWEITEAAIRDWLARNAPDTLELQRKSGYQWKDVFLPSGSLLRTVYEGRNYHCHVEGDRLLFQGAETSPNRFIAAVGGVRRSAWRTVWVLLQGTSTWTLARDLRRLHTMRRKCL